MTIKVSPMALQKAKTLASINNTTVTHQLKVLARRTARLNTKAEYIGSVAKAQPFYLV